MNKPQDRAVICDIDLTFVDSGTPWLNWLVSVYGVEPDFTIKAPGDLIHYNLSKYFPKPLIHQINPYDFWEDPHLYDKLRPIKGAVQALESIKAAGHPIRFGSYCKNGHFSSKARMVKRETSHFLDIETGATGDGFYATKVKNGIKGAVIIDDRNQFLNQFDDDVIKIKFLTPYTQDEAPRCKYDLETDDWAEIRDFTIDILK